MPDRNGNFVTEKGRYIELTGDEIKADTDGLMLLWDEFIKIHDPNMNPDIGYRVHDRNLLEIIKRVDKRKTYYYVFHGLRKICEYKEVAIECFWIITLKPFMVIDKSSPIYNCPNEMFAYYLILSVIRRIHQKMYPDKIFEYPSKRIQQDTGYNLKYCDLSREALITFTETLAQAYKVGLDILPESEKDQYESEQ